MQQFALSFERDSVCITSWKIAESGTKFRAVFFPLFAGECVIYGRRKSVSVASMNMDRWRNDTHKETVFPERDLSQYHFGHLTSMVYIHGFKPRLPWGVARD